MKEMTIKELQDACYNASFEAGWWTDLETGQPIPRDVNTALIKLCLVHSEISESMEGFRKSIPDNKLPHRDMAEVELADGVIRIMDLAGAYGFDLASAIEEKMAFNAQREDHKIENRKKEGGKAL